jgi:hypothetical protein
LLNRPIENYWIEVLKLKTIFALKNHALKQANIQPMRNMEIEVMKSSIFFRQQSIATPIVGSSHFGKQVGMPEHLKPIVSAVSDQMKFLHFDCGIRVMALSNKKLVL